MGLASKLSGLLRKRVAFVDPERCRMCVVCVGSCPLGAIRGSPRSVPSVSHSLCTGCGLCMEACRFGAIEVRWKWSVYPIAAIFIVISLGLLGALSIYGALHHQPQTTQPQVGAGTPGVEGFNVTWQQPSAGQVNYSYYDTLEGEAGTEGG